MQSTQISPDKEDVETLLQDSDLNDSFIQTIQPSPYKSLIKTQLKKQLPKVKVIINNLPA